jgi:hypothetical protein
MKIFKEIQRRFFPFLVALSALSVSASAAFYSVTGLSKLFAGASFEVLIMASSLEIAKLIIASLLYQHWSTINKVLRTYLTIATVVLVIITSAGIYGFLSSAYQETATKVGVIDKEVAVLELKRDRFIENRDFFLEEKKNLDQSIKDLRNGLSNNVIQYKDEDTGEIITTTSSSTRKVLQSQLDEAITNRNDISIKLEQTTDSITNLDLKILDVESGSELSGELGPLKYISELTDTPMNKVVNYLLIILVLVFDPLAIALVISANFLFEKLIKRNKKEDNINDTNDLLDNVDIINDEVKPEINTKRLVYKRRDDKG